MKKNKTCLQCVASLACAAGNAAMIPEHHEGWKARVVIPQEPPPHKLICYAPNDCPGVRYMWHDDIQEVTIKAKWVHSIYIEDDVAVPHGYHRRIMRFEEQERHGEEKEVRTYYSPRERDLSR